MTEIDLIDLGFKRIDITVEESGSDKPFYYYINELSKENYRFCMMSNENDNTINSQWWVQFMEVPEYLYMERTQVENIINSIKMKIKPEHRELIMK